ncbi:Uncharacterised protein [Yersinia aldovae]|nr:Uncharacterised protein [Yersinia aldovae]
MLKYFAIIDDEGHEKLCAGLHSQQKLCPVDKKDLICEEGEDLLLLLRYDPPFRSHPLLWDHYSGILGDVSRKTTEKRFACHFGLLQAMLACVKNDELQKILISFFY